MTEPKEMPKPDVPTRTPKKKTQGIFDNLRKLPQPHPVEEIMGLSLSEEPTVTTPSTGSTISTSSTPSSTSTPSTGSTLSRAAEQAENSLPGITSTAPQRDYAKVANSIVREAVPAGIFGEQGGKGKELYDYLYSLTRGAIVPRRKIRIPKDKLMRGAGIGSEVTLRKNLGRLRAARLVKEKIVPGTHGGNEYEVLLPEEVGLRDSTPSTPSRGSSGSNPSQDREGVEPVASTPSSASLSLAATTTSEPDKTSSLRPLGTIDDDDAALADLVVTLREAIKEVTGKAPLLSERDRYRELGEVIAAEFRIAAARTTVSSAPSFLAEHLRRRLFKKDKNQLASENVEAAAMSAGPSRTLTREEISHCPDCGGSGMYYPEGYEKGVAKCKHERLPADQNN